jgi:hypothetical protein
MAHAPAAGSVERYRTMFMPKCARIAATTPINKKAPTAMAPTMMAFNIMA